MRILIGKVFGIGNAVMAVPMIKAIQSLSGHSVDILVGGTTDDVGAYQILRHMVGPPEKIHVDSTLEGDYDLAIMAIPFDGRWRNGVHFRAKEVWDGRTRPDPSTTGLVSWKRHESDYQMDHARKLGFTGETPTTSFFTPEERDPDRVYIGIGYKKDAAGFWKVKHWGNENYAALIREILGRYPKKRVVITGDNVDLMLSSGPIFRMVNDTRLSLEFATLEKCFKIIAGCGLYVGNDTGMMHVAASCIVPTIGIFRMGEKSIIKSSPLGPFTKVIDDEMGYHTPWTVMKVIEEFTHWSTHGQEGT